MTTDLTVGTATAAPGTRADGRIVVSRRPGDWARFFDEVHGTLEAPVWADR